MDAARVGSATGPLNAEISALIEHALGAHERKLVDFPERRQAAVLILLFERDEEPWVVLTRRTETVATHKGQISFPGGSRDPEDADLWDTAVRETVEELGIQPQGLRMLGQLDDYPTFSSGFVVSPYIGTMAPPSEWAPSPYEIAEVIELPLRMLAEIGRTESWEREGIRFPMHVFEVDRHYVWGVTAYILRRFLDVVGPALGHADGRRSAEEIVARLATEQRFDWVGIYWVEGPDLVLGPFVGPHPAGHERIPIPEGVCGSVAASGRTEVVPDVRARPGHIACDINTRSEVVVPIRRKGRIVGVLDVDSNTPDAFGPGEVVLIERAAEEIGSAP